MCDELEIFEFLEMDWQERNNENRKRRQLMRELYDPFEMDDNSFIKQYRLSINVAQSLIEELAPFLLSKVKKSTDLSVETKVLTALYFYAHGSNQKPTGENKGLCMAQQTVSAVLAQVTAALNHPTIRNKYIKFPSTLQERTQTRTKFYQKFNVPGVIGCIDNTHIAIVKPFEHAENYLNNQKYYSLNVQFICNADMKITSVDASHGGSKHDTLIWMHNPLQLEIESIAERESMWLLGDARFPLRKTLLTPILDPALNSPEEYYTSVHKRAIATMEGTISHLKSRFRCLLSHQILHYEPLVASSIVNACSILHNICNEANIPMQALTDKEARREADLQPVAAAHHGNGGAEFAVDLNTSIDPGIVARKKLVQKLYDSYQIQ